MNIFWFYLSEMDAMPVTPDLQSIENTEAREQAFDNISKFLKILIKTTCKHKEMLLKHKCKFIFRKSIINVNS